jgi:hypothetical protein
MEGSGSRSWRSKTYGFGSGSGIKTEVITGSVLDTDSKLVRLNGPQERENEELSCFEELYGGFIWSLDLLRKVKRFSLFNLKIFCYRNVLSKHSLVWIRISAYAWIWIRIK